MYLIEINDQSCCILFGPPCIERNIVKDWLFSIPVASDTKMPLDYHPPKKRKNMSGGAESTHFATSDQTPWRRPWYYVRLIGYAMKNTDA